MITKKRLKSILLSILCFLLAGCLSSLEQLPAIYKRTSLRYEKLLLGQPQNLNLRLKLANFYYQLNDYEKVKELLKDVKETQGRIILAKALAQLKSYTSALEVFEQVGEINDEEYLYFYAAACEEKNLFPQAIKLYKRIKSPFKEKAEERIKKIGIKVEQGIPLELRKLLKEEEGFLSSIDKEEAAVILVDETIEIREDNTSVSRLHMVKKILKEKGKDLAEVQIGYDSTYERVELEYARVITPTGKVVYAGRESIRDVSKYLNFPLYSNAKAYIISMPSVEVGSIIEYKAKIHSSKLINGDDFTFIYRLRERYPIARANFKLIVPKEKKIRFRFSNQDYAKGTNLTPLEEEKADMKVYSWKFNQIDPIIPEEKMPQISLVNPAIIISSFGSWEEIYSWWYDLFKDKVDLSKEIKEFIQDLIKDCKTDYEKAKKIYEFCAKDIRYVGVEYGESGHEPHKAEDVFVNRYGDCKDQATLLTAMLREAGLKAYPVLIPTRSVYSIEEDFPSVNFNHAIAAFSDNNKLIFMDPTASTVSFSDLPLDDQQRKVLVFFDEEYKILSTPLIKDNAIVYEMKIDIDDNEDARIERKVITKGYFASGQRYYLKYTHPQQIKDNIAKKMVQISPFSKLIDYKIENVDDFDKFPVLEYTFQTKKFLNPAKDLRIVPSLSDIGIDAAYAGKEERNFPIEFAGIFKNQSRVEVKLPSNLRVKYFPQNHRISTKWFDFKSTYTQREDLLDVYQEFALRKRFVEKEDYQEFKRQLEEVFYLLREEIILEKEEVKDEEKDKEKRH
ncbi:MAG: DUF3857 domain-containing protein [Candidatus Omnitrophica bacterium]|nr:DUF3857 domain-containing protein [Candidatus Omnitrophota bacterium]MBU1134594.1 DUF3857 domain-containing protein [Candidatus Omnitrophota bacterium]MBU1810340.1 DUF3857 domain-containing protein [Candidatus Omnitrophota bacterium]